MTGSSEIVDIKIYDLKKLRCLSLENSWYEPITNLFTFVCVCVCAQPLSCDWLFVTPWTVACQVPLSMEFSRLGYWSGLPFPSWGGLLNPWIELMSLASPALAGGFLLLCHLGILSCVCVLITQLCLPFCVPMDFGCKAPLSVGFSRQEYWSGLPFPSQEFCLGACHMPVDLLNPFFKKIFFYWNIVALQYCVSFYCKVTWISYMYTHIPSFLDFFFI